MEWSIEKELIKLANTSSIEEAVSKLRLVSEKERLQKIKGATKWVPGGAETYIYPFSLFYADGTSKAFMLKAVTAYSLTGRLDNILSEWVSRRRLIQGEGIKVPELYYSGQGVVLEKYIPYSLEEKLQEIKGEHLKKLLLQVFQFAGVLTRLGFCPVSPFSDLRTDINHIFVIDFGEDLGPYNLANVDPSLLLERVKTWMYDLKVYIDNSWLSDLEGEYLINSFDASLHH